MRLLLVEDDQQLSNSLAKALKRDGFSLLVVNNGKEAIVNAEFENVDIVILDLGLPDMDGLEVLKKIKSKNLTFTKRLLTKSVDSSFRLQRNLNSSISSGS